MAKLKEGIDFTFQLNGNFEQFMNKPVEENEEKPKNETDDKKEDVE